MKPGNGGSDSRFLSDVRASTAALTWTRSILSREYHASALTGSMQCGSYSGAQEREHAAVASDEHQARWIRNILSREYRARAGPVLSQAACGSYSGSERLRGNMQLSSASRESPGRDCARFKSLVAVPSRNLPVAQPECTLALMACATRPVTEFRHRVPTMPELESGEYLERPL